METLSPLLTSLQRCCDALADLRRPGPNTRYTMADFGLAAFSVFFMQSPSFPAPSGAGARPVELPEPVRHDGDPVRQSDPGHARPGRPGAVLSGVRGCHGHAGADRRAERIPPPERPGADRAGRNRVLPIEQAALCALLVAGT